MTETSDKEQVNDADGIILTDSLINREELDEFKAIAFKEYGIRLSDKQAFEQATALINLFDTLVKKRLESTRGRVNINTNRLPDVTTKL